MAERRPTAQLWIGRAGFVSLAVALIFLRLLPLDTVPRLWAPPDLLLAVTIAWMIRKPDTVPVVVVAALFLVTDALLMRPPGLYAAIVVVVTEMLRRRWHRFRRGGFALEWGAAALAITGITLANRLILSLTMVPRPPLLLDLVAMGLTVLGYPLVVVLAAALVGLRRRAPGEVDALGHQL